MPLNSSMRSLTLNRWLCDFLCNQYRCQAVLSRPWRDCLNILGAEKHLYKCVCPSVSSSVHLSVRLFVMPLHIRQFRGVSKHRVASISSLFFELQRSTTLIALSLRPRARWVEMIWNLRVENWAIHSSTCSFVCTAHSFAGSALLASIARSAVLIRSLSSS